MEQTKVTEQTSEQLELQVEEQQAEATEQAAQTTETNEQQPEAEAAEQPGDDMAAIMAGYNKPAAQEQQQEPQEDQEAAPRTIAGLPEEELAAKLKKVDELEAAMNEKLRKVNNMLGNMKQRLETIPKDAPKAEVRAITADSMKKLRELGFDEIAEALAEDLNGSLSVQSAPVNVDEAVSNVLRKTAEKELDDLHPGWKDLILVDENSGDYLHPKFSAYVNTLPEDMQSKVRTTTSAAYAVRVLDSFKEWEKGEAEREAQARNTSEARLKNAMTPTQGKTASTAPSRLPDEAGLWAGYNKGHKPFRR